MAGKDYQKIGDWNAYCAECGAKHKAGELIRHWQGYYLCSKCWEPRQPQDLVSGVKDDPTVPWAQPLEADFIERCTIRSRTAFAGYGMSGCSIAGSTYNGADLSELT